ncbi:MAG: DNA methyltransferase, partial [Rectinemataceae bacterium]
DLVAYREIGAQLDFAELRADHARETALYAEFPLSALHENLHRFNFILGYEQRIYKDEDPVNIEAAELMGALHDELRRLGYEGHPLELLLVRLMFCFFADDTGIFQKDQFSDYLESRTREDGSDLGSSVAEVFRILNTSSERRMKNLPEELAAFPYVNGQLFAEAVDPPWFDGPSRAILLHSARFNWASVSPAIFGSLFQSVMEPKERRSLGAHYTSEKNILKTIHGLFLDEMSAEFEAAKIKRSERALKGLLDRVANTRLLDPACGCGNFLILAYRELRRLEIACHRELRALSGDKGLSLDIGHERGITVDHLYGIEIAEFPAQIARVALWIMDHLMNVELSSALGDYRPSVPLAATPGIAQGNALRLDWKDIVSPSELSYILGNPPFSGAHWMNDGQREDIAAAIGHVPKHGLIDYVGAWYIRAADYIRGTAIQCAFVSTNSITQGEQVGALWGWLIPQGIHITFAHRTFKWSNEAKGNAAVHCVIVGFSLVERPDKFIYDYETLTSEPVARPAKNINPYLVDARDAWIARRSDPLCAVPGMVSGNKPIDDGNYLFTPEEKADLLAKEPDAANLFRRWLGGDEFLNRIERWCLYVSDVAPGELRKLPETMKRIEAVRKFRAASSSAPTQRLADTPTLFHTTFTATGPYLAMPQVSSERRNYIPIAYLTPEYLCGDKLRLVRDATLFHFGVLTSQMHMAWMRQVTGRLKSDYQYSAKIVYNNFPWPECTKEVKLTTSQSQREEVNSDLVYPA